jgi:hypothetical protein
METQKVSFSLNKVKSDEWFTPIEAVYPILKYINPNSIIWCPFDTEDSFFVKVFREKGFKVIATHIINGDDFFKIDVPNCDYIISNPPYSKRNNVLKRLFELKIPFAMLMNTNGLFDSEIRWNLFKDNNFSLIYLKGRTSFNQKQGKKQKTSPPFQSAYICGFLSERQIIFEERPKLQEGKVS